MSSTMSPMVRLRLKAAARELAAAVGGAAEACRITGLSKGAFSRCCGDGYDDILSLWAAMALETAAGLPVMATIFAEASGHVVAPAEGGGVAGDSLGGRLVAFIAEVGDVAREAGDALRDGVVTPLEADKWLKSLGDVERVIAPTKRELIKARRR